MTTTPPALADLARQVAARHDAQRAAYEQQKQAEAALLSQLVETIGPALPALCSRIRHRKLGQTVGLGDSQPGYSDAETFLLRDYMIEENGWTNGDVDDQVGEAVRGVLVGAATGHESTGTGTQTERGQKLFLLVDGRFALASYRNETTQWQGRRDVYAVDSWQILTPEQVVNDWELDEIAAELNAKLQAQLAGRSGKTTAAAGERARKLAAVSALLGGRK